MSQQIRVALPGYDALNDTNLDHYALYVDTSGTVDNVLIKENVRGIITLANHGLGTISHNLGYIPFYMVFAPNINNANKYNMVGAANLSGLYFCFAGTNNLIIENDSGGNATFKYFIFYDQQV